MEDSHSLTRANRFKYLGVTFSSDLSWSLHISNVCKKTRTHIGMLYRNFYKFAVTSTLLNLYKSLIRPLTEYACVVWAPHLSKDIQALENTQKFALRVCLKDFRANYDLLLSRSGFPLLSARRELLKLCMLFNILSGRAVFPGLPVSRRTLPYPSRLPNSIQLTTLPAKTNSLKYSFFPSSVIAWNSLNFDVASKNSLLSFKRAL